MAKSAMIRFTSGATVFLWIVCEELDLRAQL